MRCLPFVVLVFGIQRTLWAAAIPVDAPAGVGTNEGNSSLAPLHTGTVPARFQQVYDASLFSALPPEGGSIAFIVFRTDLPTGGEFWTTLSNIEVVLSTTQAAPDALNSVFSANLGADATTVIGPGPLRLEGAWGPNPPGQAEPLSVIFNLSANPFFYNPSAGNLLLDIRNYAGGITSPFDAVDVFGDSVSSVFATGNPLPEGGNTTTRGLFTAFSIMPIPEPATWVLVLSGAAFTVMVFRRRIHHPR
jgi:hypothetical protein